MNRRGFLQRFLAVCASPLVPTTALGAVLPVSFSSSRGIIAMIEDSIPWTGMGGIDRAGNSWWRTDPDAKGVSREQLEEAMRKLWADCSK